MPKTKVFIVEDDVIFSNQLEIYLEELGYWLVGKADNAKDAIEMIAAVRPDLILLDIHLKGNKDGVDIAAQIKAFNNAPIIFISSLTDDRTYQRVKAVRPIAFIDKPISKLKLKRTIELIVNQLDNLAILPFSCPTDTPKYISIKNKQSLEKIELAELISIEVLDKQCELQLVSKKIITRTPLKDLIKSLPAQLFIQTHRSFVVNLSFVKNVHLADQFIILTNDKNIPLSRSFKEAVLTKLNVV